MNIWISNDPFPQFAATGAAVAYAISMCGMYLVFAWTTKPLLPAFSSTTIWWHD